MTIKPGESDTITFSDGITKTIKNKWTKNITIRIIDTPENDSHMYWITHPATEEDYAFQFWTNNGKLPYPKDDELYNIGDYIQTGFYVTTKKELNKQKAWEAIHGPLDNVNAWFQYTYSDKLKDIIPDGIKLLKNLDKS